MLRRLSLLVLALLAVAAVAALWAWSRARASLPRVEGRLALPGLAAPVRLERDAAGLPTLTAASVEDAVRAQGFLHAQERFFQMDLSRRATAAELAALFGPSAVEADRQRRRRQRRRAAQRLWESSPAEVRRRLEAYSEGVNVGLESLGAPPPEYLVLRARPEPWTPQDSMLVLLSFYDTLSFNHRMEKPLGVLAATLPAELFDFLTPSVSRWDAPLVDGEEGGWAPTPIPGPEVVDLRGRAAVELERDVVRPIGVSLGSNNWAVAGWRSAHGGAILANDPHLGLRVPHVWHRIELELDGRRIAGVGAPGLPGVVIGSNGDLAWGATNSFADQTDLVVVEVDPRDETRYLTPDGAEPFTLVEETIAVRGGEPRTVVVRWTRWGPVEDEDWLDRPLVARSTLHEPGGVDFGLFDLMFATSIEQGVEVVDRWRGPSQNWLLAQSDGRIAWVVNGPIPRRTGFSGKLPTSWATAGVGWDGERPGPRLVDPPDGLLYTANGRTVPHGDDPLTWTWMHSARVRRIEERLTGAAENDRAGAWDEASLRAIQLDVESAYHDFAVDLVREVVEEQESDPQLRRMRQLALAWDGTAGTEEAGFVVVAELTEALMDAVLEPLLAPAAQADEEFVFDWALADEPVRRMLEERPAHLVPPPHPSWEAFLRALVEEVAERLAAAPGGLERTWGEARPVTIRHPLDRLPFLGGRLDMPTRPLPGWAGTVRAQTGTYGASMRMVVSPGREASALLHMPTGQVGHFLSAHYADQQRAWAEGLPTPMLAGEPVSVLELVPPDR